MIGLWAVLHEVRSEYAQLLGTIYLLVAGPGRHSLDALLARGRNADRASRPGSLVEPGREETSVIWRFLDWLIAVPTWGPRSIVLIRVMAGGVFLWEGILKFVFPNSLGVRRFLLIGIPAPEVMSPFIGGLEIVAGVLLIAGLLTRPAALLLIADIVVAIVTTKIPVAARDHQAAAAAGGAPGRVLGHAPREPIRLRSADVHGLPADRWPRGLGRSTRSWPAGACGTRPR